MKKYERESFDVIKGDGDTGRLIKTLENRGYSSRDIEKIGYKNFLRVMISILRG